MAHVKTEMTFDTFDSISLWDPQKEEFVKSSLGDIKKGDIIFVSPQSGRNMPIPHELLSDVIWPDTPNQWPPSALVRERMDMHDFHAKKYILGRNYDNYCGGF